MSVSAGKAGDKALVTPAWLHSRLQDPEIKVLDASWYMPAAKRDPAKEFCLERIPGSKFFDLDGIADKSSDLPHMLPTADSFAAAADVLGIKNSNTIVLYDRAGIFSSPRAWWTFKAFGHSRVAVLDGGYPAWKDAQLEVDTGLVEIDKIREATQASQNPPKGMAYKAELQKNLVRGWQQVLENVQTQREMVVDARGGDRFSGQAPEPRKGLRGGHIPSSLNIPFTALLADGRFLEPDQLRHVFQSAGVDWQRPIVASCGTGVTAGILALGLHLLEPNHPVAVYDGSWYTLPAVVSNLWLLQWGCAIAFFLMQD